MTQNKNKASRKNRSIIKTTASWNDFGLINWLGFILFLTMYLVGFKDGLTIFALIFNLVFALSITISDLKDIRNQIRRLK